MQEVSPTLEQLLQHQGPETHAALSLSLLADTETPISLFLKLAADEPDAFLLESVEGGELLGRYSFIGFDPAERMVLDRGVARIRCGDQSIEQAFDDPLEVVQQRLAGYRVLSRPDLPRFQGGAVGYLGFDCVRYFEQVPMADGEGLGMPEAMLLLADSLVIYDHLAHKVILVVHVPLAGDRAANHGQGCDRLTAMLQRLQTQSFPPAPRYLPEVDGAGVMDALHPASNRTGPDLCAAVEKGRAAIRNGEVFQVVLSRRWSVKTEAHPFDIYRSLRTTNPSPYMFYLVSDGTAVVGASPEVLVRLEGDELLLRPIAGTRPRGATPEEDQALARDLLADEKELAEHRMLVDLARNDLGRVAELGSVRLEQPLHIERYSHVMHIVTDVRARLRDGFDAFDVFRASFPAGTVSGAPKIRAMQLIAELEPDRRGVYAGAVGYFDFSGNMDTCIAIRTLVAQDGVVHLQAGAGVVFDSVPENEQQECLNKARGGLVALQRAEGVRP